MASTDTKGLGRRVASFLLSSGQKSDIPLGLLWHHSSGERDRNIITARWGVEILCLPMISTDSLYEGRDLLPPDRMRLQLPTYLSFSDTTPLCGSCGSSLQTGKNGSLGATPGLR